MTQPELFEKPAGGIKCLSLWQPWATFVMRGWKANETRCWPTRYRGELAIQAAKNRSALPDADDILEEAGFDMEGQTTEGGTNWHLGSILCLVNIVDCVPTEKIRADLSICERAMGDYSDGRFAWIFENVRPLKESIPIRGFQGIFNLDPDLSAKIRTQVKYVKP